MDKLTLTINKRKKRTTREEWQQLEKEELIDHILKIESHNFQLKNLLQKKLQQSEKTKRRKSTTDSDVEKPRKVKRSFDFNNSSKRHVLLKVLYFGWDYHGFAVQEDSNDTIEYHLFEALTRTCLIESRGTSNYHRCGRTDKTVSAFCQVVSIDLRSKFKPEDQLSDESLANEIDYCGILNRVLPNDIQCVAWMPLRSPTYSARFDCSSRTYRYYFPQGALNIEAMRAACKLLERHTDFRNFCKMDVQNGVTSFIRNVQYANIKMVDNQLDNEQGYRMFFLEIRSNAFLFHQIRCIMSILFLIGLGKEEPKLVSELLDIENNPCKPQYSPALGVPLNLFKCDFKTYSDSNTDNDASDDISKSTTSKKSDITAWIHNENAFIKLIDNLQGQWAINCVKTTMLRNVIDELMETKAVEPQTENIRSQCQILQDVKDTRTYQKLLSRKRCESLESRIEHFVKKQRLIVKKDS